MIISLVASQSLQYTAVSLFVPSRDGTLAGLHA